MRIKDTLIERDTTIVHKKDSTIIIPKSDLGGSIDNPCDSAGKLGIFRYRLGSGAHRLELWSDGKAIHYNSTVDSLISQINSVEVERSRYRLESRDKDHQIAELEEKVTTLKVTQYTTPWWKAALFVLGGLVIGTLFGRYILRLFGI